MINNNDVEFIVFDVETTGLRALSGDRIIEIAAVKVKEGQVIDTFESFVNPGRLIPEEATLINNITNEMVADAPSSEEVMPMMLDFIGNGFLVAHNIKFDLDFLCYELSLIGRKIRDEISAIDTLKMSKRLLSHFRSHRLEALAISFGIRNKDAHRALSDVKTTAQIFDRFLTMAKDQGIDDLRDIIEQFGVQKPTFKLSETNQGSLF